MFREIVGQIDQGTKIDSAPSNMLWRVALPSKLVYFVKSAMREIYFG